MDDRRSQVFIYEVVDPETNRPRFFVSPAPHDLVFSSELPAAAIIGELLGGPELLDPEQFVENGAFIQLLHGVIARDAGTCPDLLAEAEKQRDGHVFIIDARTPTPSGDAPGEDIIGAAEIRDGSVVGYQGNPNYAVLSNRGFMRLDSCFIVGYLRRLRLS